MLDFVIVCFVILIVSGAERVPKQTINTDYLNKDQTLYLRGALALGILIHHLFDYAEKSNIAMLFRNSGYLIVAVFFFFSGYGLMINYLKSGNEYLSRLIKNKLPRLLLLFLTIGLLYMIVNQVLGNKVNYFQEILKLFGSESIIQFSWYITMICILYIFFIIAFLIFKKKYIYGFGTITFLVVLIGLILFNLKLGEWWYVSLLSFPVGIYWAINKECMTCYLTKYYLMKLLFLLVIFRAMFVLAIYGDLTRFKDIPYLKIWNLIFSSIIFVCIIIMLSSKIKLGNFVLKKIGMISLELYLFQGMWLSIAEHITFIKNNESVFIFSVISGTIITAYVSKNLEGWITKRWEKVSCRGYNEF